MSGEGWGGFAEAGRERKGERPKLMGSRMLSVVSFSLNIRDGTLSLFLGLAVRVSVRRSAGWVVHASENLQVFNRIAS